MSKHNLFIFSSNKIIKFVKVVKFIVKLFLMLFLVGGFLLCLSPQYLLSYQASLIDKVDRLESIEEPKIVLVANSNLAFGIESEEIEEALGMPVVNMGLHGSLGNAFLERMALFNVREGDIYIICHTNYWDGEMISNYELAWVTIENHFKLWGILRGEDIKPMIKAYPVYLKKCIDKWLSNTGNLDGENVYSRSAFNKYGDIDWEDEGLEYEFQEGDIQAPAISDSEAQRLNDLNDYLAERGATLLIAGYPIADTPDRPSDEVYVGFKKDLSEKLKASVISDFTDYIYPTNYFFDTIFHLNNIGKKARTSQLIQDLRNYYSE